MPLGIRLDFNHTVICKELFKIVVHITDLPPTWPMYVLFLWVFLALWCFTHFKFCEKPCTGYIHPVVLSRTLKALGIQWQRLHENCTLDSMDCVPTAGRRCWMYTTVNNFCETNLLVRVLFGSQEKITIISVGGYNGVQSLSANE